MRDQSTQRGGFLRHLMVLPVPWVFVLAYLIGASIDFVFFEKGSLAGLEPVRTAGIVVFGFGAVIAGWAWVIFHQAHTTRVPGEASTTLVTWGPYRVTRNPMYVGLAIAYVGEAGILKQAVPVAFLPLVIAYLSWIVIPIEERKLQDRFGDEYDRYRSIVRRWL